MITIITVFPTTMSNLITLTLTLLRGYVRRWQSGSKLCWCLDSWRCPSTLGSSWLVHCSFRSTIIFSTNLCACLPMLLWLTMMVVGHNVGSGCVAWREVKDDEVATCGWCRCVCNDWWHNMFWLDSLVTEGLTLGNLLLGPIFVRGRKGES